MRRPDLTYREWAILAGLYLAKTYRVQADRIGDVDPFTDADAFAARMRYQLRATEHELDAVSQMAELGGELHQFTEKMTTAYTDAMKDIIRSGSRSRHERDAQLAILFSTDGASPRGYL